MLVRKIGLSAGTFSMLLLSISANADPLYLIYKTNDTGSGMASLVYPSIEECQSTTGLTCVKPKIICGGHEFATVKTSYDLMKDLARAPNGDWLMSVGKDIKDVQKKYEAAEKSNFKIKLCESKMDTSAQVPTFSLHEGTAAYEKKDYATAVEHLKPLSVKGDAVAQYMMGDMTKQGVGGLEPSNEEAVRFFKLSAEQDYGPAQFHLANLYRIGKGTDKSLADALFFYKKAEKSEHTEQTERLKAQVLIGYFYEKGWSVEKSDEVAVRWYKKAAEGGDASGQFILGQFLESGRGGAQSHEEAVELYKKSSAQGYTLAMNSLGNMYQHGKGVSASSTIAADWYLQAAKKGNVPAQFNLGTMYYSGQGVSQSHDEAFKLFQLAVDAGDVPAMVNLGVMYARGEGTKKSHTEARKLFHAAAKFGNFDAQFHLANMYYLGSGGEKSETLAIEWMQKAHEQKYEPARQKLIEWGVF